MVRNVTLVLIVAVLVTTLAVGTAEQGFGQDPDQFGPNMRFGWSYPEDGATVDSWNIRIQRRSGDTVIVDRVFDWPHMYFEVENIKYGDKISISVQGVNEAGVGIWSEWSDEHFREPPDPEIHR